VETARRARSRQARPASRPSPRLVYLLRRRTALRHSRAARNRFPSSVTGSPPPRHGPTAARAQDPSRVRGGGSAPAARLIIKVQDEIHPQFCFSTPEGDYHLAVTLPTDPHMGSRIGPIGYAGKALRTHAPPDIATKGRLGQVGSISGEVEVYGPFPQARAFARTGLPIDTVSEMVVIIPVLLTFRTR
jgi:hypothetical protein